MQRLLVFVVLIIISTTLHWTGIQHASARTLPVPDIGVGEDFACTLTNTGDIYCWGDNTYGQLGDGSTTDRRYPV